MSDVDLPAVRLGPDLHRVVMECEPLFGAHDRVYQRGGKLIDVAVNRMDSGVSFSLREMPISMVRLRLTEVAKFQSKDKREGRWKRVLPPDVIVNGIAGYGRWPSVRPLLGIRETPFLRPDGTICCRPGYDYATLYSLVPTVEMDAIDEAPTREQAQTAANELLDVVGDFPFSKEAHRTAWLAMLLTMIARPAIEGPVPAFGISATVRGSGKGKLVDAASNIFVGRDAGKHPFPENDAELKKTLTSLFLSGKPVTVFDNVARVVHGAAIDNAITATTWEDRELGRSLTVVVPNITLMIFTGNNLTYGGDTSRRVLPIELDAGIERPELRAGFRHRNLLQYIRQERPRLIAAALTILRAYCAAGRPKQDLEPWGSFESWSDWIPSAIVWLGLENPLFARASIDEVDDSTAGLMLLFDVWQRLDPQGLGMTTKYFLDIIQSYKRNGDPLCESARAAVAQVVGGDSKVTALTLSYKLRSLRRRVLGGRYFDVDNTQNHVSLWRVHSVSERS